MLFCRVPLALAEAARALPYPERFPLRLSDRGSDCRALSGTYRNMPSDWEDAGHGLATLTLSTLLGTPRVDRLPEGAPSMGVGRIREQHEAEVIVLDVGPDGAVQEARLNHGPLQDVPMTRCRPQGRAPALELKPAMRARAAVGSDSVPPELRPAEIRRIAVTLLPTSKGDLIARIDVLERRRGVAPIGYAPISRYWLRYPREAEREEFRAGASRE